MPVGRTSPWGWQGAFMHLYLVFAPAFNPTLSLCGETQACYLSAFPCLWECAAAAVCCNRRLVGKANGHLLRLSHSYSQDVPCSLHVECSVRDKRLDWPNMVQLMLSFIGSSWRKPESHGLISLAPHLPLCQMDDCSGVLMHICSGSWTSQGIMLGLKEINLFMKIKMNDGGLGRTSSKPCCFLSVLSVPVLLAQGLRLKFRPL